MDTRALDVSSHVTLSSPISNGGSRCFAPAAAAAAAADTAVSGSWAGTQEGETHSSSSSGGGGGGRSQAAAADSAAGAVVGCPYQQLFRELLQVGYHITKHVSIIYITTTSSAWMLSTCMAGCSGPAAVMLPLRVLRLCQGLTGQNGIGCFVSTATADIVS